MWNFLNSNLHPKVVCKSPSTDGYEVENLISDEYSKRVRGFIAYPAIKPPVEIEFEFICPVNIDHINLNTVVGSQKCNGIEIYARNEILTHTLICKSVFDKMGIIFCNSRKYSKTNPPEGYNNNYELCFFRSNAFRSFLNASSIKIVIFRTDKSVPCLRSVEVWGIPSKSCSQVTINTITKLATKSLTPNVATISTPMEEFKIPEDFKDDLTCNIMSIPMTLPSGKTVDQSTLEKHIQNETSFGRKPCDPFTGIKFTDHLKPIMNVALKTRIDMFILQNSHRAEISNMGRTIGRASGTRSDHVGNNVKRKHDYSDCNGDLEEAISKVKRSTSFMSFTDDLSIDKNSCVKCKNKLDILYKIPCEHYYCRVCLLLICENSKCSICDISFMKSEVQKCNL
ncbi:U-box domain containing 5 [Leptinotarsa decemlineata]|uniref:U-box domain containing 5 n=1 Tax=Leptinotarsa decemlineata TaxID=7539 RepID=UPI000C2549E0|nr:RING finger protein 37 [Leptinotarsa decemlineata]